MSIDTRKRAKLATWNVGPLRVREPNVARFLERVQPRGHRPLGHMQGGEDQPSNIQRWSWTLMMFGICSPVTPLFLL